MAPQQGSARRSKKQKWRVLGRQEAEKELAASVAADFAGGLGGFVLDTEGRRPSKAVRKRLEKGSSLRGLTERELREVRRLERGLAVSEAARKSNSLKARKTAALSSIDLWDSAVGPESSSSSPSEPRKAKLPPGGISINPDSEEHAALVISTAAVQAEHDALSRVNWDRVTHPVAWELLQWLPPRTIRCLNSDERAAVYRHVLTTCEDEQDRKAAAAKFIAETFHLIPDEDDERDESFAGEERLNLPILPHIAIADDICEPAGAEEAEEDGGEEGDDALVSHRSKTKQRTEKQKKRFRAHLQRLKLAAKAREEKRFRSSVQKLDEILREFEALEERSAARKEYRQALNEAKLLAEKEGHHIRYKLGRYEFVPMASDLLLPAEIARAGGSLRKTPFAELYNGVVRETWQDFIARKKVLPPMAVTAAHVQDARGRAFRLRKATRLTVR